MPYSHHSHSGQFCPGHAKNTLEEMVQTAVARKMQVFALTEHMPREEVDFYPEESGTLQDQEQLMDHFYAEASRLRAAYASSIDILIGFESEWIRPSSLDLIRSLQAKHRFDFFMGSVHHVHTIPIDYDRKTYEKAQEVAGGSDDRLFEDYFDSQYEMLQALQPLVVGHFDLIRLLSDNPNAGLQQHPGVWRRILRNLDYIVGYGGILELNAAGLRKGLDQPYPCAEICEIFMQKGGRFTISDDSHGIDQVATNYARLLQYIRKVGIERIYYLQKIPASTDTEAPSIRISMASVASLKDHSVWAM